MACNNQIGLLVFGIFLLIKYVVCGPLCYECHRIPYPRDCDRIRQCGPHERCYTSQYISTSGAVWYDTGCFPIERCVSKRSADDTENSPLVNNANDVTLAGVIQDDDIITCDQCCEGDFCNSHGCGSQPLPGISVRGPVCFSCHQQPTQNSCEVVTTCKKGEKCYLLPHIHSVDVIYSTGCLTDAQCDTLEALPLLVGRRDVPTKCGGCCDGDYCNLNCTSLHGLSLYTSSTPSHTHSAPPTVRTSTRSSDATASSTTRFTKPTTSSTTRATTITTKSTTAAQRVTTLTSVHQTSTTTSPLIDQVSCNQRGYTFYPTYNLCYKLYQVKNTWHFARELCIRDGGDLIVFSNQGERDYFDQLARGIYRNVNQYERRFWIGATDIATEQNWLWVDGTRVLPSYFHPNEPNNAYDGEDCGAMTYFYTDNHTWINDDKCDTRSDYMCQLKLKSHASGHQICTNSDYQHVPHSHLCYKIYKNHPLTWQEAQDYCEREAAHLLILDNKQMEDYFANRHFYNEGDSADDHRYWIGGNDFHQRHHFTWINGRSLSADLTWNPSEPNNFHGNERCLDFTSQFGKIALNDDDCSKQLYFICQTHS